MKIVWADQDKYYTGEKRHNYRAVILDVAYGWGSKEESRIPDYAQDFCDWLATILLQLPPEIRKDAKIRLRDDECDECSRVRAAFVIYVDRMETDEEYAKRHEIETGEKLSKQAQEEAKERALLAALKKKYE